MSATSVRGQKVVLEIAPSGEVGYYTTLADFCRANAGDEHICRRVKKLKKGESAVIGSALYDDSIVVVTSLGTWTRAQRRVYGIFSEEAEHSPHRRSRHRVRR
jgi:hypothetical protein